GTDRDQVYPLPAQVTGLGGAVRDVELVNDTDLPAVGTGDRVRVVDEALVVAVVVRVAVAQHADDDFAVSIDVRLALPGGLLLRGVLPTAAGGEQQRRGYEEREHGPC